MNTELLRAAIGPRSDYYLRQFEKIEGAGDRWVASWNWPAFFFSTAWFQYRRMTAYSWANFLLPLPFALLMLVMSQAASPFTWLAVLAYITTAFVAIPLYANTLYYRRLTKRIARAGTHPGPEQATPMPRPPSLWTRVEAVLTAAFTFTFWVVFMVAPVAYSDYQPRRTTANGLVYARPIKFQVEEFYEKHRRLPASDEGGQFRAQGPSKYTESAVYDAASKRIVITYRGRLAGKRIALHAEDRGGAVVWTCRSIDVEERFLPISCR